jgi:hypothetical protein
LFILVVRFLSSLGKIKYIIAPVFITITSLAYYAPCEGFCFFTGNGFPLSFYVNRAWHGDWFGIDCLIWGLIVYPISLWLVSRIAKCR